MLTVDEDKAIALLEKAVAEKGEDTVVDTCTYFDRESGSPCCIVGHALYYLVGEVGMHDLFDDEYRNTLRFSILAGGSLRDKGIEFTDNALAVLGKAQRVQDGFISLDRTWGNALDEARCFSGGLTNVGGAGL